MSRKPSPTKDKALYTATYKGWDIVEVLNYSIVFGKTYVEIRFSDGRKHTVPAEDIYVEKQKEEKK